MGTRLLTARKESPFAEIEFESIREYTKEGKECIDEYDDEVFVNCLTR